MTDYEARIVEARKAQRAVYLAAPEPVAADLSRIIKGLADAVETLLAIEQRLSDHIVQLAAERDAALRALAESRARYGDLEVQRAEAQAVIAKVRKHLDIVFGENSVHMSTMRRILDIAPSVVLEDRDREVAARALEDAANDAYSEMPPPASTWLSERAAAIREGEHA